jgi:galactokinase/mevalonate kinase-like predicted kinase
MMKVARENDVLAAKLAGAGGGTIMALTLEPERTIKALKEVGAETFVELAPDAEGAKVEVVEDDVGYGHCVDSF